MVLNLCTSTDHVLFCTKCRLKLLRTRKIRKGTYAVKTVGRVIVLVLCTSYDNTSYL